MWSKEKRKEYDREYSKNNRERIRERNKITDKKRRDRSKEDGSFVYCIHCLLTGKKYIGSSKNLIQRIKGHYKPSQWKSKKTPLYDDMILYGKEHFIWGVLEKVEEEEMLDREKYWIQKYNTIVEGYNQFRPYRTE